LRTNPKPLAIFVCAGIPIDSPSLIRFKEKGHEVKHETMSCLPVLDSFEYDVVIGPKCWRIDPRLRLGEDSTEEESLERQLELMEKGVRAVKFPKEVKSA
jgi:hypothetical protein